MQQFSSRVPARSVRTWPLRVFAIALALSFLAAPVHAQKPRALPDRLSPAASLSERIELARSMSARVETSDTLGHLSPETPLQSIRLVLQPTPAQQSDLAQLLANQSDPKSASFRQWLTPAQFGTRFGVSDADLAILQQWLTAQGFTVDSGAPGRNAISFSGTSAIVESAFGTTMQRYSRDGQNFFANGTNLHIPAAFSGIVAGVANLSSYRLKSTRVAPAVAPEGIKKAGVQPDYTIASTGQHYLTPYDFRQIYDLNGLVGSGNNGHGISIAVAGQSAVDLTQIANFQTLTGQAVKAPTLNLVPGTGVSTAFSGDEGESEIDLEYAGGTAPGADIQFVYTGNSPTAGVFNAVLAAIDNKVGNIISLSYGSCETDIGSNSLATLEYAFQQANTQGQTVVASSGDTDAATCDQGRGLFTSALYGATVSYPASSAFVTGVGGTRLDDANNAGNFWAATNNSQNGSALGYIPEIAWNDTALVQMRTGTGNVLGSGGGVSKIFGKPSWQTGLGVPADGYRDVPDVSFAASPNVHGFEFCSSEATAEQCTATAFAPNLGGIVGGTSLSAPNFAAMLAIIEQTNGNTQGLGNINPLLYATASSTSGKTAFHDVTSGDNFVACVSGYPDCGPGQTQLGYQAGVGYDLVTGLGSIDGSVFAAAVKTPPAAAAQATVVVSTLPVSSTSTSPSFAPTVNTTFLLAATVNGNSLTLPTGTVVFSINGAAKAPVALAAITATSTVPGLSSTANFTVTGGLPAGTYNITAAYSGDSNYPAGTSLLTFTIVSPAKGSFALAALTPTLTIASGGKGFQTLTITPTGGFADLVNFTASASPTTLSACSTLDHLAVPAGTAATATFYINLAANCTNGTNAVPIQIASAGVSTHAEGARGSSGALSHLTAVVFAGLLAGCLCVRRTRKLPTLLALLVTFGALSVAGCGNGSAPLPATPTPTPTPTTAASYKITVTGTSATNASITASTSFTLTIQ